MPTVAALRVSCILFFSFGPERKEQGNGEGGRRFHQRARGVAPALSKRERLRPPGKFDRKRSVVWRGQRRDKDAPGGGRKRGDTRRREEGFGRTNDANWTGDRERNIEGMQGKGWTGVENGKKDIASRWKRRLAFTVSEASLAANGERGFRPLGGKHLSGTVGQFKRKIQKVN